MKFNLAIPVYDDFDSVSVATIANAHFHRKHINEIVIVDNNPDSHEGQALKKLCASAGWKYVAYRNAIGTAAAKDMAIRSCQGWTVCMDSHVVLLPGFFDKLDLLDDKALYHGPLVMDNGQSVATSLSEEWSDGMKGKWQNDGFADGIHSIKNNGTGMFVVNADHWLGYNPNFRGFGGEEWYLQQKYIKYGNGAYLHTAMKWWHRFGCPRGKKYPLKAFDKFRNYMIGFEELGLNTKEVVEHFLATGLITKEQSYTWRDKPIASCNSCSKPYSAVAKPNSVSEAMVTYQSLEPDIAEHTLHLAILANKCKTVLDVGSRLSSSLALASAAKGASIHYGSLSKEDIVSIRSLKTSAWHAREINGPVNPQDIDLVFIDTDPHSEGQVYDQLIAYGTQSNHYIVLHDANLESVKKAVGRFVHENRNWTVINTYENNNGLMVLSCDKGDKEAVPALHKKAASFARSLAAFTLSGWKLALPQVYEDRVKICEICPHRNNNKCGKCGCPIDKKASWATEKCPDGRW